MPKRTQQPDDEPDLFDLLEEQERGPLPCPHVGGVGRGGSGWTHQRDPKKPYFLEWVHSDPRCRRSAFPGKFKTPLPTMGWSRELQKDVPLGPA